MVLAADNTGCPACHYQDNEGEQGHIGTMAELCVSTGTERRVFSDVSPKFLAALARAANATAYAPANHP
jgi:hypothetical protein